MTIKGFELLDADSKISTLNKLRRALEANGVEFINEDARSDGGGPGVRLRAEKKALTASGGRPGVRHVRGTQ